MKQTANAMSLKARQNSFEIMDSPIEFTRTSRHDETRKRVRYFEKAIGEPRDSRARTVSCALMREANLLENWRFSSHCHVASASAR
jgi:hypothetical protein